MQIRLGRRPVPQGDDDIAFDALRPRRLGRGQFAGGDAIGPLAEQLQRALRVELADVRGHIGAGLARLNAPFPRIRRGFELAEVWRQCARCLVAELVAGVAAVGLDDVEPLALALQLDRHAVGAGAGKQALVRDFEQRIPIDRRIIFRGRGRARGRCGLQVDILAGFGLHLRRIDETVAANPNSVFRLGQIGYQVTPAVVGDDDLGEFGRKIGRLGDNPDTGFRSVCAGNHAAKVAIADLDRLRGGLLRIKPAGHGRRERGQGGRRNTVPPVSVGRHFAAPPIYSLLCACVFVCVVRASSPLAGAPGRASVRFRTSPVWARIFMAGLVGWRRPRGCHATGRHASARHCRSTGCGGYRCCGSR